MIIGNGANRFEWREDWARVPDTPSGRENGRTHGVAVTRKGEIVVFRQADPAVLIFDRAGNLKNAWGKTWAGAHGLRLVNENGAEYLWLTDERSGEVAKTTLDGRTVLTVKKPDLPVYQKARYSPTWVDVNPRNGDIWVADGYGAGYIHRYTARGGYLSSINVSDGAVGGFACPHGIFMDTRRGTPELYITDRSHRRVQVYDGEGRFQRVWGSDFLHSPCDFAIRGKQLVVPELFGRVALLDEDDHFICHLGENQAVSRASGGVPGWPNVPASEIQPGRFNSPHGVGCDPETGDVYIVEWIVGGRIIKMESQAKARILRREPERVYSASPSV